MKIWVTLPFSLFALSLLSGSALADVVATSERALLRLVPELKADSSPACRAELRAQLSDLIRYDSMAASLNRRAPRDANPIRASIHARISRLEGSTCFAPVAKQYAQLSLLLPFGKTLEKGASLPAPYRLLSALLRADPTRLRFLTPTLRRELGGSWRESVKGTSGALKPKVLGAYDCAESAIWVDPFLSPFDFRGALTHELDHLARDKFVSSPIVDLRARTLLDEMSSTLHAAYSQAQLAAQKGSYSRLENDLSLFARDGAIAASTSRRPFAEWLERSTRVDLARTGVAASMLRVRDAYFRGASSPSERLIARWQETLPFAEFLAIWRASAPNHAPLAGIDAGGSFAQTPAATALRFAMEVDLKRSLAGPSPACREFLQAMAERRPLTGYAGSDLSSSPAKGNDGGKPGDSSVSPAQGNEGGKPGEWVQPCLSI